MGKKTVLVIDDDLDLRDSIAMALEAEGYRVWTAANGKSAFELLETKEPSEISCIVLDLMMPGMDGQEFFARLRENHVAYAGVPVIIATAMGVPVQDIVLPYPAARIQKPMELEELYRLVREASA